MSKSNAYLNVSKSLVTLCSVIRNFKALILRRKKNSTRINFFATWILGNSEFKHFKKHLDLLFIELRRSRL